MLDMVISGGHVLDGLGTPAQHVEIGIKEDLIVAMAPELPDARTTIDAEGAIVCPGFVDMHAHSGLVVFEQPDLSPKIRQGITTEVIGVDGISVAPVHPKRVVERQHYVAALDGTIDQEWSWHTFPEYISQLQTISPGTNLLPFVPHGALRDVVMGLDRRPATRDEIDAMCVLLDEALACGAGGLSLGLIYVPGAYAQPEELYALACVAARYDRLITVHVRNEEADVVRSVKEMAQLARETGARMHISHLKIVGRHNAHLLPALLDVFEAAERVGLSLSFDQYPYTAGNTQLAVLLPPWAHEGGFAAVVARLRSRRERVKMRADMTRGLDTWENLYRCCGWDNIIVSSVASKRNRSYVGHSVQTLAQRSETDPFDLVFDLLLDEKLQVGMIDFYCDDAVVRSIFKSDYHTASTDGIFDQRRPHPRLYGAYPRILGQFVRDERLVSLPEAIKKMTSRPAQLLGLRDRGVLRAGNTADIVVFDLEKIHDLASYDDPMRFPPGIEAVIVNGRLAVDTAGTICERAGEILRLT